MASNEGKVQSTKPMQGKKIWISVDNDKKEVLEWNEKGARLLFHHEADKFLKLNANEVSKLSTANKQSYNVSKEMFDEQPQENPVNDIVGRLGFSNNTINPRVKMEGPESDKFDYGWRSAADLGKALSEGWQVVSGEKTKVNPQGHGESKLMGKDGKTEQVMVKIRRDLHQKLRREKADKVDAFVNRQTEEKREEYNRIAGSDLTVDPNTKLTPAASEGGN